MLDSGMVAQREVDGEGAGDPGRKHSEEGIRRHGSDFLQGGVETRGLDNEQGSTGLRRQVRI